MTYRPQSSPGPRRQPAFPARRAALLAGLLTLSLPGVAAAQDHRTLARESRIYATVGGASLGLVTKGTLLASRREDGASIELLVDGWIFARSVGADARDGFDLAVTQAGGQNLRESPAPGARIVARLTRGALLQKVEADGHGWVHVRRYVWVPKAALQPLPAPGAPAPAAR
ncbi:MAG TPA: SH3 domain-containing protein, partial [Gemmatimonadales bacterium]|nr:SH3 domain-containing protein [Gemmatimonadales bacterium]